MNKLSIKTIFMGNPEFGAIILKGLINNNMSPDLVVTSKDKPVGRKQAMTPSPVKTASSENNIPLLQPEKLGEITEEMKKINPDLIIVAAYGKLIPKEILEIPKYKTINVHPSLLPKYRGSSPIQSVILNGEKETGTTIMVVSEKLDSGPIINQEKLSLTGKETAKELHDKLAEISTDLLIKTIPQWISGKIKETPQDEKEATYYKEITKEEGKINWQDPAENIERKVRAFNPWPGTFTIWDKVNIKILESKVSKSPDGNNPVGKVLSLSGNKIAVQCGKDLLVIEKLQQEGKNPVKAEDFIRGHKDFIGTILK